MQATLLLHVDRGPSQGSSPGGVNLAVHLHFALARAAADPFLAPARRPCAPRPAAFSFHKPWKDPRAGQLAQTTLAEHTIWLDVNKTTTFYHSRACSGTARWLLRLLAGTFGNPGAGGLRN